MSEENSPQEFNINFSVSEILGDSTKDIIHKRPLMNAETMIKRGKLKSALEIYARVISRLKSPEAKEKVKSIVYNLQDYLTHNDVSNGDHKLSPIDPEKDFSSALKELTDHLTDSLTEGLQQLEKIQDESPDELDEEDTKPPKKDSPPPPIFVPTSRIDMPAEGEEGDEDKGVGLEYPNGLVVPPITIKQEDDNKDSGKIDLNISGKLNRDDIFSNKKPRAEDNSEKMEEGEATSEKMEINLKVEGDNLLSEEESKIDKDYEDLKEKLKLGLPEGLPEADWTKGAPPPPPTIPDVPQIDILSHLMHHDDWGPYKHLPIQDRRSGEERRKSKKPIEKDRRETSERRKRDLFQEREDFLKQWSEKVEQIRQQYGHLPSEDGISSKAEWPSVEMGSLGEYSDLGILGAPIGDTKDPDLLEINLPSPVDEQKPADSPIDQDKLNEHFPENPPDLRPPQISDTFQPANVEYIHPPGTPDLVKIGLPNPLTMEYEGYEDAPKRNISWIPGDELPDVSEDGEEQERKITKDEVLYPTRRDFQVKELFKIELPDPEDISSGIAAIEPEGGLPDSVLDEELPEVDLVESDAPPGEDQEIEIPEIVEPQEPEKMIHGILELKPPEVDDAPFLTLTYDFSKIPHSFRLSKNYSIMEYSYYKYKTMLMKAQEFARRKMLKNALNYYRVIKSQNIPPELKKMINRNIMDITEFLEKYLMSKGG